MRHASVGTRRYFNSLQSRAVDRLAGARAKVSYGSPIIEIMENELLHAPLNSPAPKYEKLRMSIDKKLADMFPVASVLNGSQEVKPLS